MKPHFVERLKLLVLNSLQIMVAEKASDFARPENSRKNNDYSLLNNSRRGGLFVLAYVDALFEAADELTAVGVMYPHCCPAIMGKA